MTRQPSVILEVLSKVDTHPSMDLNSLGYVPRASLDRNYLEHLVLNYMMQARPI
jgi:hypothetical protein